MIFYCTKLHFSKDSGSWAVSIKRNRNFKFQQPLTFVLFIFLGSGLIETFNPLKIYHHTKTDSHTLTDTTFTSTSEIRTFAILEWLKLRDWIQPSINSNTGYNRNESFDVQWYVSTICFNIQYLSTVKKICVHEFGVISFNTINQFINIYNGKARVFYSR
jgi:hypothetical protein